MKLEMLNAVSSGVRKLSHLFAVLMMAAVFFGACSDEDLLVAVPNDNQTPVGTNNNTPTGNNNDSSNNNNNGTDPNGGDDCIDGPTALPSGLQGDLRHNVFTPTAVRPGFGYKLNQNLLTQICVEGEELTNDNTDANLTVGYLTRQQVRDRSLSIDVSVNGGISVASASARLKVALKESLSTSSVLLEIRHDVVVRTTAFESARLTDQAARLALNRPLQFRETCGTRFVSSVTEGGSLVLLLRIETRDESERNSLVSELSAAYSGFVEVNAGVEQEISNALSDRKIEIEHRRVGGGNGDTEALANPSDIPRLLQYAARFAQEARDEPVVISYTTRPYGILPEVVCVPGYNDEVLDLLAVSWRRLSEVADAKQTLNESLNAPEEFACQVTDTRERRESVAALDEYLTTLEREVRDCSQQLNSEDDLPEECVELQRLINDFEMPHVPFRWTFFDTFKVDFNNGPKQQNYQWRLRGSLCGRPLVDPNDQWSGWADESDCQGMDCWQPCPEATLEAAAPDSDNATLRMSFWDTYPSNNRGECKVRVGCMRKTEQSLLDTCP